MLKYRRSTTMLATAALAILASAAVGPSAHAAEPYTCTKDICIYENVDGTGASLEIDVQWQGGYNLIPSGWANRASSAYNRGWIRNIWLYTTGTDAAGEKCYILKDFLPPGEKREVSVPANKNFDLVGYDEFNRNPCHN